MDSILIFLQKELGNICSIEAAEETKESITYLAYVGKDTYTIIYNKEKDTLSFKLVQGGVKTYSDPDKFFKMFSVYVYINSDFIPRAKKVSNLFENECHISSVYQTFEGNVEVGFTAIFKVLGKEGVIQISDRNDTMVATLYEDGTLDTALISCVYSETDDGEYKIVLTPQTFLNRFIQTLNNTTIPAQVKVESYEEGVFLLKFDNSIFRVALDIIDDEIIFELLGINDNPISAKITIENPYDVENFILRLLDIKKEGDENSDFNQGREKIEEEVEQEDCEVLEQDAFDKVESGMHDNGVKEHSEPTRESEDDNRDGYTDECSTDVNDTANTVDYDSRVESGGEIAEGDSVDEAESGDPVCGETEPRGNGDRVYTDDGDSEYRDEEGTETSEGTETEEFESGECETGECETGECRVESYDSEVEGMVSAFKIEDDNGVVTSLGFVGDNFIYTCDLDALKPYNIPLSRITDTDSFKKYNKMIVLDIEVSKKMFAVDKTNDADLISSLVKSIFGKRSV